MEIELNELDRRIWERELADWLPEKVFDFHSHIQHSGNLSGLGTEGLMGYVDLSAKDLDDVYRTLVPGRSVRYLVTHFPDPAYDTTSANRYDVAHERPPGSYSLMVVLLHLSKSRAAADPENLEELSWYSQNFPRARLVLAHCARCFNPWTLELALPKLRKLNLAYDTAAVCDGEIFEELIAAVGPDLISSTLFRGKYVGIGESWTFVTGDSFPWRRAAAIYEELRALALRLLEG